MKKLSKIAQVTFFAAAFAVLFSGTADAYIDPSVMNYAIQACLLYTSPSPRDTR